MSVNELARQLTTPACGSSSRRTGAMSILIAIVIIGVVGLLLEQGLMLIARRFSWQEK